MDPIFRLDRRVIGEYLQLQRAASQGCRVDLLSGSYSKLSPYGRLIPEIAYGLLHRRPIPKPVAFQSTYIGSISTYPLPVRLLPVENPPEWTDYALRRIEKDLGLPERRLTIAGHDSMFVEDLHTAFKCLAMSEWCPLDIWLQLVSVVVRVDGKGLQSASVNSTAGAIFLSRRYATTPTSVLDLCLHEGSHLYLEIVDTLWPLVLDSSVTVFSAIRGTDRPLIAVLHAAYVLTNIVVVFGELAGKGIGRDYDQVIRKYSVTALDCARAASSEHKVLTEHGVALIEWICKQLD